MSDEPTPQPSRRKCTNCGLVNIGSDEHCRRCGGSLAAEGGSASPPTEAAPATKPRPRSLFRRMIWVVSVTLIILIIWYFSLLISSDGLQPEQNLKVDVAIGLLELRG